MKQLLLVEDDRSLGATLAERLSKENFAVRWATDLAKAEAELNRQSWDLVLLDLGLPDGSGLALARKIKAGPAIPIVFITALNTAENRLAGFEMGAEEFIPKPFHLKELLIRVRRVLESPASRRVVRCGDVRIDLGAMCLEHPDGRREHPASRDFRVLELLIRSAPRVVSRDEILDHAWGEDKFPSSRTVDNAIVRLRQLLRDGDGRAIRSARGVGYQWVGHTDASGDD
jgi:DNA-binding response OmpR family regulator